MDASSIITQVSRDDDQLGNFSSEKGKFTNKRDWPPLCWYVNLYVGGFKFISLDSFLTIFLSL